MSYIVRLWLLSVAAFMLSSCTPTTGNKVAVNQTEVAKIKSIGVVVKKEEGFSVRLSREEMTNAGGAMLGLIGVGIEAGMRRSSDKGLEEQFKPIVGDYAPENPLSERVIFHLQTSGSMNSFAFRDTEEASRKNVDAILELTVREWGLRRCPGTAAETVQPGFNVNGKLYRKDDRRVLWEREEIYLNGDCRPWPAFKSDTLVKDTLPAVIDNLATKLVYEIVFP
jgi:hypothetical protein